MFWFVVSVATFALAVRASEMRPNTFPRANPYRRIGRTIDVEAIFFADGPLAGRTDYLEADPNGLPPYQFCALVTRPTDQGGDYTLPYQRGAISELEHAWSYTQGWTS